MKKSVGHLFAGVLAVAAGRALQTLPEGERRWWYRVALALVIALAAWFALSGCSFRISWAGQGIGATLRVAPIATNLLHDVGQLASDVVP